MTSLRSKPHGPTCRSRNDCRRPQRVSWLHLTESATRSVAELTLAIGARDAALEVHARRAVPAAIEIGFIAVLDVIIASCRLAGPLSTLGFVAVGVSGTMLRGRARPAGFPTAVGVSLVLIAEAVAARLQLAAVGGAPCRVAVDFCRTRLARLARRASIATAAVDIAFGLILDTVRTARGEAGAMRTVARCTVSPAATHGR